MSAALTHAVALVVPEPPAVGTRWETEHRVESTATIGEERELV